ncbi:MAG: hypothetical protein ACM30E_02745 [Nitrososphaerales archaeon]
MSDLIARASIDINAPAAAVWRGPRDRAYAPDCLIAISRWHRRTPSSASLQQ